MAKQNKKKEVQIPKKKRGPGRPRNPSPPQRQINTEEEEIPEKKRGRGRPKKRAQSSEERLPGAEEGEIPKKKRGPGRPRKPAPPPNTEEEEIPKFKRGRGRPRKDGSTILDVKRDGLKVDEFEMNNGPVQNQEPENHEEPQRKAKNDTEISLPDHDLPHLDCTPLVMETLECLKENAMYVEENIDFMLRLSAIKNLDSQKRESIWIPYCRWFYQLRLGMTDSELKLICQELKPWSSGVDVFSKKLLIIPAHTGPVKGGHWALTVVANPIGAFASENQEKCTILVFDSLGDNAELLSHINKALTYWLKYTGKQKNVDGQFDENQIKLIEVKEVPKQTTGSNDCGPFVCHFAEKVMQSLDKFDEIDQTFNWRTIGNHETGSNIRQKIVDDVLENASATFKKAIAAEHGLRMSNEEFRAEDDREFERFELDPTFDNYGYTPSPCSLSKECSSSQSDLMSPKEAAGSCKLKDHLPKTDQAVRKTGNPESIAEDSVEFELDPTSDYNRWFGSLSPSPLPSFSSDENSPSQSGFKSLKAAVGKSKEHSSHTSAQSSRDQVHRESGYPDRRISRKRKSTDHDGKESSGKLPQQTEASELSPSKNGTSKDDKRTIEAQPKEATSSNMRLRLENVNGDQSSVNAIANMLYSCDDVRDIFAVPRKYTLDKPLSRAVQSIFRIETHTARAWRDKIEEIGQGKQDICKMVDLLLTPLNQEELLYPLTFCVTPNVRCEKCRRTGPLMEVFERFNNVSMENDTTFADLIAREYREKPAAICKCGGQLWERRIISIFERYHIMVINHNLNKGTAEKFINFHSNDIVEMFEDDKSKQIVRWKLRAFAEDVNDKNYQSWLRFEDGWMCLRDYNILVTRRHEVDMSKHCVKILVFERLDFPS